MATKKELESASRAELKSLLEEMSAGELKRALETVDGATLKEGLQVIDAATLREGINRIDRPTLRESLQRVNIQTLKEAVKVMDKDTFSVGVHEVDTSTRNNMLDLLLGNGRTVEETHGTNFVVYTRDDVFVFNSKGRGERLSGSPVKNGVDSTTDGCTWVPDFDFEEVCNEHDRAYSRGGTETDREAADSNLRDGIEKKGHPRLAKLYHWGVRKFGKGRFNYKSDGKSDGNSPKDGHPEGTSDDGGFTGDINVDPDVPNTA